MPSEAIPALVYTDQYQSVFQDLHVAPDAIVDTFLSLENFHSVNLMP